MDHWDPCLCLQGKKRKKKRLSNLFPFAFHQNRPQHLGQIHQIHKLLSQICRFINFLLHSHKDELFPCCHAGTTGNRWGRVWGWPLPEGWVGVRIISQCVTCWDPEGRFVLRLLLGPPEHGLCSVIACRSPLDPRGP